MTLRSMSIAYLSYSVYMVYLWTMHGHQGRVIQCQHRPHINYINRVAIQQKLLVKFSCNPHINSLLRALLVCVIIGLCVQWLPQHYIYYYADKALSTIKYIKMLGNLTRGLSLIYKYFMYRTCVFSIILSSFQL